MKDPAKMSKMELVNEVRVLRVLVRRQGLVVDAAQLILDDGAIKKPMQAHHGQLVAAMDCLRQIQPGTEPTTDEEG